MNDSDLEQCLGAIKVNGRFREACLIHTFAAFADSGDEVTIRVCDFGPISEPARYYASLIDQNGKESQSARGDTMVSALGMLPLEI
jgi:hypothetical protein